MPAAAGESGVPISLIAAQLMARPAGSEPEALAALATGFILAGFTLVQADRTAAAPAQRIPQAAFGAPGSPGVPR